MSIACPTADTASTLVLGVGNILLTDEGAGVHALEELRRHSAMTNRQQFSAVKFLDAGTLSFTLAADIEDADNLIVFDAANLDASPGHVECFVGQEMDNFLASGRRSVHEVGLADLMDIARITGHLPSRRALIGIQPAALGWGEQLSTVVSSALPTAANLAVELLARWSLRSESSNVSQVVSNGAKTPAVPA